MSKQFVCIDVYTTVAGDTLYSIAEHYELPVSMLMLVNRITNPYNLRIGQRLCIPGLPGQCPPQRPPQTPGSGQCPPQQSPGVGQPPQAPTPERPEVAPACRGTLYTVKAGDTLYGIARENRVSLNAVIEANPNINPYQLSIGSNVCIPR